MRPVGRVDGGRVGAGVPQAQRRGGQQHGDRAERLEDACAAADERRRATVAAAATATATTSQVDHVEAVAARCRGSPRRRAPPAPCRRRRCATSRRRRRVHPSCSTREGRGEDGAGAEQHDDRESRPGRPTWAAEPPGDAGDDTDEEGQVGPRQVGVEQRAGGPEADESRLVRRDLQRLGGLEDDGAGAQRGEESCGADQRAARRGAPRASRRRRGRPATGPPRPRSASGARARRGWRRPARSARRRRSRRRGRAGPGPR